MSQTVEEAGLGEAGEEQPSQLTLSSTYNAADADVELRSKDGVRFLVHRANLLASSKMLAGMFELVPAPEAEVPIIYLKESGAVLHRMLADFYPKKVPRLELGDMDEDVALIAAFDKYEVWRGIEAFAEALHSIFGPQFLERSEWPSLYRCLFAYAFSKAFQYNDILASAKLLGLLESARGPHDLEGHLA